MSMSRLAWPRVVLALGVIGVVATAVRVAFIGPPVRYDEAFSFLHYASQPWKTTVSDYSFPNNHFLRPGRARRRRATDAPRHATAGLIRARAGALADYDRGVTARALRKLCLSFPGAYEDFPFDREHSVFRVEQKMFALSALGREPLKVNLKCEPELAESLRASYPDAIAPGWHMNKRHWNTVHCDGTLSDAMIRDMVEDSYDLIVAAMPRAVRERLGWAVTA